MSNLIIELKHENFEKANGVETLSGLYLSRVFLANEEKTQYMLLCLPERFDLLRNKSSVNTVVDIRGYCLTAGEFSDIVNKDFDETKLNSFLITEPFDCELTITLKGRSILAESPTPIKVGGVSYSVQGNQIETYLTNHKQVRNPLVRDLDAEKESKYSAN